MKSALLLCVSLLPVVASAQPTTAPVASTQPSEPASILVVAFNPPANGQYPWIGEAIARDLGVNLRGTTNARVYSFLSPVSNPEEARRAAANRQFSVAVFGSTQVIGNQVRATGQVIDATSGKTLGPLNAVATSNNLFPLEDQLAGQVVAALPKDWVNAPAAATGGYSSAAEPEYQSYVYPDYAAYPPGYYAPYDYYSYPRTYYDYTYAYPSWWWYEPYIWYGPIYYHGYWHHHHWDGDHDWDDHFGRPWRHGFGGPHTLGPRPFGSPYAPHGPQVGHVGGAGGHAGGGHITR